jgi:hypothetical protein
LLRVGVDNSHAALLNAVGPTTRSPFRWMPNESLQVDMDQHSNPPAGTSRNIGIHGQDCTTRLGIDTPRSCDGAPPSKSRRATRATLGPHRQVSEMTGPGVGARGAEVASDHRLPEAMAAKAAIVRRVAWPSR